MVKHHGKFLLHHPGIVVPDIECAIRFYGSLLHMTVVKSGFIETPSPVFDAITGLESARFKSALLRGENFFIELFEFLSEEKVLPTIDLPASNLGIRHLAFQVEDMADAIQKLLELGGSNLGEVRKVTNGGTGVYCRDPFGNIIELLVPGEAFPEI
jgi:glyoxylase I family protein